jgi:RNA polymerase sigma-70 factor (ECF subfamily)
MGVKEEEADDAMQRVLIQLARRWEDLGRLPPNELHAYACTVAAGIAIDVGRERGRRNARLVSLREGADSPPDDDRPDDAFEHKRKLEVLDRILQAMPEERRVVFILHEIEELAMRQIADRLGLAMGTVASRLRKAREEFDRAALRARAVEERKGGHR